MGHSHPDYVDRTISGVDPSQPQSINDTPFQIMNIKDVHYKDLMIPFMKIVMKGALVTLERGTTQIPFKFLLTSTDPSNHGDVKNGKEWHLLVIPISKSRAENIQRSTQTTKLSQADCIPASKLRIQVCKEARGNKKLMKQHRNIEVEWPLQQSLKRKRLEREYFQIITRKISKISDQQLEQEIQIEKSTD